MTLGDWTERFQGTRTLPGAVRDRLVELAAVLEAASARNGRRIWLLSVEPYRRIRIAFLDDSRDRPEEFQKRLRHFLASIVPSRAQVVPEAGGWSVFIPGLPVAADGASFDEAITEMIDALREYAEDWQQRLLDAPNHRDNWGLVQLISFSDDEQLRDWLVGGGSVEATAEPGAQHRPGRLLPA